jgi:hypothetical protein
VLTYYKKPQTPSAQLPRKAIEKGQTVSDKWCEFRSLVAKPFHKARALPRGVSHWGVDIGPGGDYIKYVICSPLDQPKGLRRGFAFKGVLCQ